MLKKNNRTLLCLLAVLLSCGAVRYALADDELSLAKIADLNFGLIDFDGPTAIGNIQMGSNGAIIYGSNTGGNGTGTPGQLEIDGPEGTTVTIACTGGSIIHGGTTLPISPVKFDIGAANTGAYAGGYQCAGLGQSVATHTLSATASENTIYIGGQLAINNQQLNSGSYNSGGGTPPTFLILVQ